MPRDSIGLSYLGTGLYQGGWLVLSICIQSRQQAGGVGHVSSRYCNIRRWPIYSLWIIAICKRIPSSL